MAHLDRGYMLLCPISPVVRELLNEVVATVRLLILKSAVMVAHLLLLKLLNGRSKKPGTCHPDVRRKTGNRYVKYRCMKQYRDKFVQYFPTLVAEITRLHGWDRDHMKEVYAVPNYKQLFVRVYC